MLASLAMTGEELLDGFPRLVEALDKREAGAVVSRPSGGINFLLEKAPQPLQVCPEAAQLRNLPLDFAQIPGHDFYNMLTRGGSFVSNRQDAADISKRHAEGLRVADEVEQLCCFCVVQAVARWSTAGRSDEPDPIIVAEGLRLQASEDP
jgi:hypothetical protein